MADKPRIILVDQDGVLAQIEEEFLRRWRAAHPDKSFIALEDRRGHALSEQYPKEHFDLVYKIFGGQGFFHSLEPVPGAIEAMKEMVSMGFEVRICTTPLSLYQNCVVEKYQWVEKHLGPDFVKRMILTRDKTLVHGDILIDDKSEITGLNPNPAWEHVVFDAPYNRDVTGKKRMTWANWKEVLGFE